MSSGVLSIGTRLSQTKRTTPHQPNMLAEAALLTY
jgi:hypothetical protein